MSKTPTSKENTTQVNFRVTVSKWLHCLIIFVTKHYWALLLGLFSGLLWIGTVVLFYPGFTNYDSAWQLQQALGDATLSNWHPISMTLLWGLLIKITGSIGAMLIVQTGFLWTGFFLLALYVWRRTNHRALSLLPLVAGLSPAVLVISGVIWKDIHLATALLMSIGFILHASLVKEQKSRKVLIIPCCLALAFVVYAGTVRLNAIVAIVPIIYIILSILTVKTRTWKIAVLTALMSIAIAVGIPGILNSIYHPVKGYTENTVYFLDIVNILPREKIQTLSIDTEVKQGLIELSGSECSRYAGGYSLNVWGCIKGNWFERVNEKDIHDSVASVWKETILGNPKSYLSYKVTSAFEWLFASTPQYVIPVGDSTEDVLTERYGISSKYPWGHHIISVYLHNFTEEFLNFMLKPWFHLSLSIFFFIYAIRRRLLGVSRYLVAISSSSILYIMSFLPMCMTTDYRYIYWPAIANTVMITLLVINLKRFRIDRS